MNVSSHTEPRSKSPSVVEERVTVPEFARRVHRNRQTVYSWIRQGRMPPGSVVRVLSHLEINWTVFEKSIRTVA